MAYIILEVILLKMKLLVKNNLLKWLMNPNVLVEMISKELINEMGMLPVANNVLNDILSK